jgi:hypothetical protein
VEFHIIYTMIANDFSTFRQFLWNNQQQ